MAVFRVERNTGYTVMSNHHLRNKELSLKAKGLLSQMLSLPEDWDYTLAGLSYINRESIDAIRTAVWELEKAGYITRRQGRDEKGKMTAIEYTIYEQPQPPELDCPVLENPTADNPTTENPTSENPMQLNKDISRTNLQKKEKSNTDLSSTHSIPIHSLNPLPYGEDEAAQPPERKGTERNDAYRVYEEIIKDNIEYNILLQDMKFVFHSVLLQNHDTSDDKKAVPHLQKWQTAHFPFRDFSNCGSHCNSPNRDFVWLVLRQCVRCWQCQNCGHCASDYKRHSFRLVHCVLLISHEFLLFFLISPTGEKGSEADSLRLSASSNTQY